MNYKELTSKLVRKSLEKGATEAEVYLETTRNLSIRVHKGEIETIEEASTAGVGFRVIVEGKMGFSHSNDLSEQALEDTLQRAIAFARLTTPDENNILPEDPTFNPVEGLYDPQISRIPMDQKINLALELEKLALSQPGITSSSGSSYGENESEVFIANSRGINKNYKSSGCYLGVSIVAEKGDQKSPGDEGCSRVFFGELKPVSEIAESAASKAVALLDPQPVATQRVAVLFDKEVAGSLLGGVIAALSGERVNQGASFLKDSLGKKVASELLTIIDDGTKPKGLASSPFDGEGVTTQKTILLEKGIVKNFIYNTSTASRAGSKSTGNAGRNGYSSLPSLGTHNILIEPGLATVNELIAATPRGLWLKEVTGYGIDPVTGNFSGGATGLWIEDGKVVHPVKGLTIAGSADEILNGIDLIANDQDPDQSFSCPTFRIKEMQVGGNR